MPETNYDFEQFFDREGFNRSLGHFKAVSNLLGDFEDHYNLADILNVLIADKEIQQNQLSPILYALLVDKYGYRYVSYNMKITIDDFSQLIDEAKGWKAVDVVIAYHHPELGFTVLNPKHEEYWQAVQNIKRNELVIAYAGAFGDTVEEKAADAALGVVVSFFEGKMKKTPDSITKGTFSYKPYVDESEYEEEEEEPTQSASRRATPERPKSRREPVSASAGGPAKDTDAQDADESPTPEPPGAPPPAPKPPAPVGNRTMTPKYSVPVTNELFHNGNVEAWKKVIQSFETKNTGCEVLVFYEGERIHDINTLFKWGKVKHGSTILFAVVGTEIRDVAKLQRYLRQGASPQFEAFLKFPVNTVLNLF